MAAGSTRPGGVASACLATLMLLGCSGELMVADSGADSAFSDGSLPDGSLPDGSLPDGSVPDGSAPDGSAPDGSLPDGSAPDGSAPDGSAPDGSTPPSIMNLNLVIRQTHQSCSSCGIWFDTQGVASRRPRLVVRSSVGGVEQTQEFQRGGAQDLFAYFLSSSGGSRSEHEDNLLVKQTPARTGLLFADLSSIPETAEILEARLYLHIHDREGLANSDRTSVLTVYEGTREWDFATVGWNQWAAGSPWTSAGGDSGAMVREIRADRDLWGRGFNKGNPDANFDFTAYVAGLQAAR